MYTPALSNRRVRARSTYKQAPSYCPSLAVASAPLLVAAGDALDDEFPAPLDMAICQAGIEAFPPLIPLPLANGELLPNVVDDDATVELSGYVCGFCAGAGSSAIEACLDDPLTSSTGAGVEVPLADGRR